jgi:hypothetical protein
MTGALIVIGWSIVSFIVGFGTFLMLGLRDITLGNALGAMFVGGMVGALCDTVGLAVIFSMVHV